MKKLILFTLFLFAAFSMVKAQSSQPVFGRLKPPTSASKVHARLSIDNKSVVAVDTVFTGWRVQGPSIVYALPGSSAMAGVGIGYEKDTYNASTGRWYTNFVIAPTIYAGGTVAPSSISGVAAIGAQLSFFNRYLTIGGAYNIMTKKPIAIVGVTFDLFNN